jgi:methionyl aminopeptidase
MSQVILKTPAQLDLMRRAGQLLAQVFADLDSFIRPGVTTMQINDRAEAFIVETLKARPASKASTALLLNTSVDHVVCHGMPKVDEVLKEGSIINVDITLEQGGYIADSSKMYCIGKISDEARRLVDTTYDALWKGIEQVRPGATLGDIGHAVRPMPRPRATAWCASTAGMASASRCMKGRRCCTWPARHGHEAEAGMVFTIEPMINQGGARHARNEGWLDGDYPRPQLVGAVGAHRGGDRARVRSADACAG